MANLGIATVQNMGKPLRHYRAVSGKPWRSPGRNLRHQVRRARRAHGGVGGEGDRPGTQPHPADQGQGPAGDLDQPQHAECLRGVRPIHIARLGGCAGVITPKSHTPTEAVAIMTGATTLRRAERRLDRGEPFVAHRDNAFRGELLQSLARLRRSRSRLRIAALRAGFVAHRARRFASESSASDAREARSRRSGCRWHYSYARTCRVRLVGSHRCRAKPGC